MIGIAILIFRKFLVGLYSRGLYSRFYGSLSFKNQNYENCYPELANRCLEFLIASCPYLRTIRDIFRRSCNLIFFKLVLSLLSLLIGAALISASGSVSDTNVDISSVRGLARLVLFSFFIYSIDSAPKLF